MKVLAFTPQFLPVLGGIEVFTDALAQFLRPSVETVVVTDADLHGLLPEQDMLSDIAIHRLPFLRTIRAQNSAASLQLLQRLVSIVKEVQPDVIHMHSAVQASAWFVDRLIGKLSPKPPLLVTQHGMLAGLDGLGVVRSLLNKADMLTGVSNAVLQSAMAFSGRTDRTAVIYNGVRKPKPVTGRLRTPPPFMLACIGRLQVEKGFDLAIEALSVIRNGEVDAKLTVVGQGVERKRLIELVEKLGLQQHVRFAGVLNPHDTQAVIAESSLLLVPSRTREGFGLVVVEAALCGVPSVASRIGGLTETVEDGLSGVLAEPGDHRSLASATIGLLRDPSRLKVLGMNAKRRAMEKFDMGRCAEQYLDMYRNLVH